MNMEIQKLCNQRLKDKKYKIQTNTDMIQHLKTIMDIQLHYYKLEMEKNLRNNGIMINS